MDGIISTKEYALKNGVKTIGAGLDEIEASEPVYIDEAGGIGIFGVTYMNDCCPATKTEPGIFRWDDMDYIKRRIDEVKSECRWCIIVSHGGEEEWNSYLLSEEPEGFFKDAHMDFSYVVPEAIKAENGGWKNSSLEEVKSYLLKLL